MIKMFWNQEKEKKDMEKHTFKINFEWTIGWIEIDFSFCFCFCFNWETSNENCTLFFTQQLSSFTNLPTQ